MNPSAPQQRQRSRSRSNFQRVPSRNGFSGQSLYIDEPPSPPVRRRWPRSPHSKPFEMPTAWDASGAAHSSTAASPLWWLIPLLAVFTAAVVYGVVEAVRRSKPVERRSPGTAQLQTPPCVSGACNGVN